MIFNRRKKNKAAVETGIFNCIYPLLKSMGIDTTIFSPTELFPPQKGRTSLTDLMDGLSNLRLLGLISKTKANMIPDKSLPCLFLTKNNAQVLVSRIDDETLTYNGKTKKYETINLSRIKGRMVYFHRFDRDEVTLLDSQKIGFQHLLKLTVTFVQSYILKAISHVPKGHHEQKWGIK